MVKRAVSPELKDPARYLACYHPYPPHANLETTNDKIDLVLWIATCLGEVDKRHLHAVWHKPTAPNIVLLEVDEQFQNWRNLLGAHTWSEVFKQTLPEPEKDRVSKVYDCVSKTGRALQKAGWKRNHVEEKWFKGWQAENPIVTFPYPPTMFCHPPIEDKTGNRLCSPLPQELFPLPVARPSAVVGSEAYVMQRENTSPTKKGPSGPSWASIAKPKQQPKQAAKVPPPTLRASTTPSPTKQSASGRSTAMSLNLTAETSTSLPTNASPSITISTVSDSPFHNSVRPLLMMRFTDGRSDISSNDSSSSDKGGRFDWAEESDALFGGRAISLASGSTAPTTYEGTEYGDDSVSAIDTPATTAVTVPTSDSLPNMMSSVQISDAAPEYPVDRDLWGQDDEEEEPDCPIHGNTCSKGICAENKKASKPRSPQKFNRGRSGRGGGGSAPGYIDSRETFMRSTNRGGGGGGARGGAFDNNDDGFTPVTRGKKRR